MSTDVLRHATHVFVGFGSIWQYRIDSTVWRERNSYIAVVGWSRELTFSGGQTVDRLLAGTPFLPP